jgi:hypothetical protein
MVTYPALYSEDTGFESRLTEQLFWQVFRDFLESHPSDDCYYNYISSENISEEALF